MKKKVLISFCIVFVLFTFTLVKNLQAQAHVKNKSYDIMLSTLLKHSVNEVSIDSVKKLPTVLLLDAREYNEYTTSHLMHAIWVGYDNFDLSKVASIEKNTPIIVYRSVGYRSEKVAIKMEDAGFSHVSNLYGGIFEWVNKGNLVYNMQNTPTDSVHAFSKSWGLWLNKGIKVYD